MMMRDRQRSAVKKNETFSFLKSMSCDILLYILLYFGYQRNSIFHDPLI